MSLIEDEAGRSLLIEVAKMEAWFAQSLLSYVSLFKPLKSDLNNGRALKLQGNCIKKSLTQIP